MFDPDTMKVIMRQKTSKELMEWNFDDQTAKYMDEGSWDNNQNSRPYGPCATSSSGKLFLYSGNLNSKNKMPHHFQGNRGEVKDSEGMLWADPSKIKKRVYSFQRFFHKVAVATTG